jgi:hypothetical protein
MPQIDDFFIDKNRVDGYSFFAIVKKSRIFALANVDRFGMIATT